MARAIGVKNLYYAKLTKDDPGANPTFEKPVRIPKLINFGTSSNFSDYTFFSDDVVEEAGEIQQSETISIELGNIDNKLKAAITGHSYDEQKGVYSTSATAVQPSIALLYEISFSDGKSMKRVLYNCKLKITEMTNSTKADSIESSNVIIEGVAIPLQSLGILDMQIDEHNTTNGNKIFDEFFTEVKTPNSNIA